LSSPRVASRIEVGRLVRANPPRAAAAPSRAAAAWAAPLADICANRAATMDEAKDASGSLRAAYTGVGSRTQHARSTISHNLTPVINQ
jgi:hypothetical protein